jgi:Barrel-sandwich domain of CusB or HlyD membrane-fusion
LTVAISNDAQAGEMVSPVSAGGGFTRTGIATIVDMSSLEIQVDVNEAHINRVTPGQAVAAVLEAYPDWQIPGRVVTTVPAADRQKATVQVRIAFDKLDPRILPDMSVKVSFLAEPERSQTAARVRPRLLVPRRAVQSEDGQSVVFAIRDDRAERRVVRLGAADSEHVEIDSGLRRGERVVIEWPDDLTDNGFRRSPFDEHTRRFRDSSGPPQGLPSGSSSDRRAPGCEPRHSGRRFRGADGVARLREHDTAQSPGRTRPTEGAIEVGGQRIHQMSGRRLARWRSENVGFVFQLYNLLPMLTAERNVELPLLLTRLTRAERRQHVRVALSLPGSRCTKTCGPFPRINWLGGRPTAQERL